jgi:hypothetical protein
MHDRTDAHADARSSAAGQPAARNEQAQSSVEFLHMVCIVGPSKVFMAIELTLVENRAIEPVCNPH